MKLISKFNDFMNEVVNIDDKRLEILDSRISLIDSYLQSTDVIGAAYIDLIPQGSMAHKTIIKPFNSHEFDADVLLQLEPQYEWAAKDYIEALYQAFRASGNYKDRVTRKNRCVTIQYANDCHIDVVPFLELQPDMFYITNRNEGENGTYERTDPTGYTAWLDERNRITSSNLIKSIRLLKWLRDYKQTFSCKSVVLSVLTAGRVNNANLLNDDKYYSDLPTTLVHILEDLSNYLSLYPDYMPRIEDPACPEVDYNHRWDNDQYLNFKKKIEYYAAKARQAYDEQNITTSQDLWKELFGDQFGVSNTKSLARNLSGLVTSVGDPGEEFIEERYDVRLDARYGFKIVGEALPKAGFRTYDLPTRGNRIEPGRSIRFTVRKCTVPVGYTLLWKIKNRGKVAADARCLRGEIVKGDSHVEPTRYRGSHYVECYAIKDGICVARDRQLVTIL